ncbi:MAG: hypothetical protein IPK32_21395 [Verrucomicrobiaceae bacterium]|nr:hypothetical protein [Verrucomicrobiaceae bacterium]
MPLFPNSFDPGILVCGTALLALCVLCWLLGVALLPTSAAGEDWLERIALRMAAGMLFLSGLAALFVLRRVSYVTLIPVIQIAMALWAWRGQKSAASSLRTAFSSKNAVLLIGVIVATAAFEWWNTGWVGWDGRLSILHTDYGHFSNLSRGLLESRVADGWSSTLGEYAVGSAACRDIWYHWGPMWIAAALISLTGMMPLAALMHVTGALMDIILVLTAGVVLRRITSMSHGRSLLIGAASLVSVQLLRQLGQHWFALSAATESLHLARLSLAYMFSYKLEAAAALAALLFWQKGQGTMATALLACAAIASPHVVATGGVMAGVLGCCAVIRRDRAMLRIAVCVITVLVAAWATLHFVCGVGLPKAEGSKLIEWSLQHLWTTLHLGVRDCAVALILGALSLPGIITLTRDQEAKTRHIGWMALSALVGSFFGYRLLAGVADNMHFIIMAHALLVMPAGVWGLALLIQRAQTPSWLRRVAALLIVIGTIMGVADLKQQRSVYERPWSIEELDTVKKALAGHAVGYFAKSDGGWWLPIHGSLAATLEARCIRIAPMKSELRGGTGVARYYGVSRPFELVPPLPDENMDAWSLRFARHVGIDYLMECGKDTLPPSIKAQSREIARIPGLVLYKLPAVKP